METVRYPTDTCGTDVWTRSKRSHDMPEQSPIFCALIDGGRQKLMDKKGVP